MRRFVAIAVFAVLAACGDNKVPSTTPPDDAALPQEDAPAMTGGPCLDRPTDLPRPTTTLPCELLPPDFVQQKPKVRK